MSAWPSETKTALLLASDGTKIYGHGFGATGHTFGEVCFNTAMSGYQEIITDPSYASQIVAFTFPHIGNVGVNPADTETSNTTKAEAARGIIVRERVSDPSNFRAQDHLSDWLAAQQIIGISGVDTRAITTRIRDHGMFNAVLAHAPDGQFDEAALAAELKDFAGLEGADLAGRVTSAENYAWAQGRWHWPEALARKPHAIMSSRLILASRKIFCAVWHRSGAALRSCRQPPRPAILWRSNPTAYFCQTAPATRRPRALMRLLKSARWWKAVCRFSAYASAIKCWHWRWARKHRK